MMNQNFQNKITKQINIKIKGFTFIRQEFLNENGKVVYSLIVKDDTKEVTIPLIQSEGIDLKNLNVSNFEKDKNKIALYVLGYELLGRVVNTHVVDKHIVNDILHFYVKCETISHKIVIDISFKDLLLIFEITVSHKYNDDVTYCEFKKNLDLNMKIDLNYIQNIQIKEDDLEDLHNLCENIIDKSLNGSNTSKQSNCLSFYTIMYYVMLIIIILFVVVFCFMQIS